MNSRTLEEIKILSREHPIIAFDGVCNLCNGFIQWLIKRDKHQKFRYTTLQSEDGATLKKASGVESDSVLLIYNEKIYTMSDVGLISMKILGGGWSIVSWLRIFPVGFRNMIYKWIANNRYKWFGKSETCMVPDASTRSLFI